MGGSTSEAFGSFMWIPFCRPEGCCRPLAGSKYEFTHGGASVFVEGDEQTMHLEKRGPMDDEDGNLYEGQWLGDLKHGHGRLVRKDIGSYEGQFSQGKVQGQGVLHMDSGDSYDGQWQNGAMHGLGKYSYQNGSSHKGQFSQGAKHGFGQETLADNSTFEGQFANGKRHGTGKYCSADGSSFDGQFTHDRMDGKGTYRFVGGKVYEGQWQQSSMHGSGHMSWPDGRRYDGMHVNDQKSGPGKFTWANGSSYDGQWSQGRQHGHGIHLDKNGQQFAGQWVGGRPFDVPGLSSDPSAGGTSASTSSTIGVKRLGAVSFKSIGSLFRGRHKKTAGATDQDSGTNSEISDSVNSSPQKKAVALDGAKPSDELASLPEAVVLQDDRRNRQNSDEVANLPEAVVSWYKDGQQTTVVVPSPSVQRNASLAHVGTQGEEAYAGLHLDGLEIPGFAGSCRVKDSVGRYGLAADGRAGYAPPPGEENRYALAVVEENAERTPDESATI